MSAAQGCNYFSLTGIPCGLSAPQWRTVRRTILPTHQNQVPLWTKLQSIRRTVHSPLADRPQYTCANPPETTTPLEQFLNSTADCPRPSGGPSAVQFLRTPPETSSLDNFQLSTADRPLPYSGLSAVNFAKLPETTSSLDENYLTGGLSAPPRRTVRDT